VILQVRKSPGDVMQLSLVAGMPNPFAAQYLLLHPVYSQSWSKGRSYLRTLKAIVSAIGLFSISIVYCFPEKS